MILTCRIFTGTFSVLMLVDGIASLIRIEPFVNDMHVLGYPLYLMTILGIAKCLGAVVLIWPGNRRLKEWAYAGFTFNLIGAVTSHAIAGGPIAPAIICSMLLAGSYLTLRARERAEASPIFAARCAPGYRFFQRTLRDRLRWSQGCSRSGANAR